MDVVDGQQQRRVAGVRAEQLPEPTGEPPLPGRVRRLVGSGVRGRVGPQLGAGVEELEHGGVGRAGVLGGAADLQHPHALPGALLGCRLQQGGAPGAGGTLEQHQSAGPAPGVPGLAGQQRQGVLAFPERPAAPLGLVHRSRRQVSRRLLDVGHPGRTHLVPLAPYQRFVPLSD